MKTKSLKSFMRLTFQESEQETQFYRSYFTIFDFGSNFGGIVEAVTIICVLLTSDITNFRFESSIVKQIFLEEADVDKAKYNVDNMRWKTSKKTKRS